jgi:hypothetical protein
VSDPFPAALTSLQSQLHETQTLLVYHFEKVRTLEGILAEHEVKANEIMNARSECEEEHLGGGGGGKAESEDDDARSIHMDWIESKRRIRSR